MLKERAQLLSTGLLAVELGLWTAAFFLAQWVRGALPRVLPELRDVAGYTPALILLATALVVWIGASAAFGLRKSYRTRPVTDELWTITKAGLGVFLGLMTVIVLAKLWDSSRLFVVLFAAFGTLGAAGMRLAIRTALLNARQLGFNYRTLAIVGDGKLAHDVAKMVGEQQGWGLKFTGFIAVDPSTTHDGPVLGSVEEISDVIDRNVVDEVIFAVDRYRLGELEAAFEACEETGVNTRIVLNFFPHKFSTPAVTDLEGLPLLSFHATSNAQVELFFKRVFDVGISTAALTFGAPLFVLIALAIKLTSAGPVFFVQRRVGLNGREFGMIKFRSMVADAEAQLATLQAKNERDGPAFKIARDPRITPVGRFLRKTSLDELPQFLNVLRGEMSVVGPRPPLPSEVHKYERWQRRRLSVRPGITCIWQVSARDNPDFEEWMRMDMRYIENWSLWLDLKLFMQTIPAVLFGRGAS